LLGVEGRCARLHERFNLLTGGAGRPASPSNVARDAGMEPGVSHARRAGRSGDWRACGRLHLEARYS
jgi:hypothetical protein